MFNRAILPVSLLLALLLSVPRHGAKVTLFGDGASAPTMATNSVVADVRLEDGLAISLSDSDSQLSVSPFQADWADIPDGTFRCDITVLSGASNTVSVLFGDHDDPALTLSASDVVRLVPAGTFPPPRPAAPSGATTTNRISLALHLHRDAGAVSALPQVSVNGSPLPGPGAEKIRLEAPRHLPQNWGEVSLWLAGPEARVLDLRMKWRPDPTLLIAR